MKRLLIQVAILTGVGMYAFGQAYPTQSHQHGDEYVVLNKYNPSAMPEVKLVNNAGEIKSDLAYLHAESSPPIAKRRVATQRKRNIYEARNELVQSDSLTSQHEEDDANKNLSVFKKTVFMILSIVTFVGMIVLIIVIFRKFR